MKKMIALAIVTALVAVAPAYANDADLSAFGLSSMKKAPVEAGMLVRGLGSNSASEGFASFSGVFNDGNGSIANFASFNLQNSTDENAGVMGAAGSFTSVEGLTGVTFGPSATPTFSGAAMFGGQGSGAISFLHDFGISSVNP